MIVSKKVVSKKLYDEVVSGRCHPKDLVNVNARIPAELKAQTDRALKKHRGTWVRLVTAACRRFLQECDGAN